MTVRFLSVMPRARDMRRYTDLLGEVTQRSEQSGFDGVLFFAGTGALLDPWITASRVLAETRLTPLIAVNPIYMHPFTAAQMVHSLTHLYGRRVSLNFITGTALSDLEAMGDPLSHDDRYARLREYVRIMTGVLESPRPLTFDGRFYSARRLQLQPSLPEELRPLLYLAGSSPAAGEVREEVGARGLQMLPPVWSGPAGLSQAVHFGVVTRSSADEAWKSAQERFPENDEAAKLASAALGNTDSAWKRKLFADVTEKEPEYWLRPLHTFQADCPYLVADHDRLMETLIDLHGAGVDTFLIDVPADSAEFFEMARVIREFRRRLGSS